MGIVYLIKHRASRRGYVGKTERSLPERLNEHVAAARAGSRTLIGRAIAKHGIDAFDVLQLEEVADVTALNESEKRWISDLDTNACRGGHGFNMTDGGEGTKGLRASEETRAKLRNRVISRETRQRMSASARRRRKLQRSAAYILRLQKGRPASSARKRQYRSRRVQDSRLALETRDKISRSLMGHVVDEKTRKKIASTQAQGGEQVEACCPIAGVTRRFNHCNDATWILRQETGNAKIYAGNIRRALATGGIAYGYRWRYAVVSSETSGCPSAPRERAALR